MAESASRLVCSIQAADNHPIHGLAAHAASPSCCCLRFQPPDRWPERPFSKTAQSHGAVTSGRWLLLLAAPSLLAWQEEGPDCCDYSDFDLL